MYSFSKQSAMALSIQLSSHKDCVNFYVLYRYAPKYFAPDMEVQIVCTNPTVYTRVQTSSKWYEFESSDI